MDDIVPRLRKRHETEGWIDDVNLELDAADEIETLRKALQLAVGQLSTYNNHRLVHPEEFYNHFIHEARRG